MSLGKKRNSIGLSDEKKKMPSHCDVCDLKFIDEYAYHGHLLGKKHLKKAERDKFKKRMEENTIYVSPIPPWMTHDALVEFFKSYDTVTRHVRAPRYSLVEFENSATVDLLLSKPVYLSNFKFNIRRGRVDSNFDSNKQKRDLLNEDTNDNKEEQKKKWRAEVEAEPTFEGQFDIFRRLIQEDDTLFVQRADEVCRVLGQCLKFSFPNGRAIRFGSSVTGLHLKDSDVDVFLDIGAPIVSEDAMLPSRRHSNQRIWTQKLIFNQVKTVLFRNKLQFCDVVPIPQARTPVIKFKHIPTNIKCDISFKHDLGVHNSQLVKHLLDIDPRIRPLMIIIKYWVKCLDISGTGKITNYSLVMAIIFFLQQPSVNLLPTVKELQSRSEPIFRYGWPVNFDTTIPVKNTSNKMSVPELLDGFFQFYATFDFNHHFICPLDGLAHPRTELPEAIISMNGNPEDIKISRPVWIQDPFQRDYNVAYGWSDFILAKFQNACTGAVKLCEESALNNYKTLLYALCDPFWSPKVEQKPKIVRTVIAPGKFGTFGLPANFDEINADPTKKEEAIVRNWFNIVSKLVPVILQKVFKLNIRTMEEETIKQKKVQEGSDVHTQDHDQVMYYCEGFYALHRNRKNISTSLDPTLSYIEKEALVSNKMMTDLEKQPTPIKFKCKLQIKKSQVGIKLTDYMFDSQLFTELAFHIVQKIPHFINKELQHMVQYKKTF